MPQVALVKSIIIEKQNVLYAYKLLQDLNFSLEAIPISNLGSRDDLDGPLLTVLSVSCRTDLTVGTLAQFLYTDKK